MIEKLTKYILNLKSQKNTPNSQESNQNEDSSERNYFNITYIFIIIGITFALFFSLGYIDNKSKEINILEYMLFVIVIPFTFMLTIVVIKIYSKLAKKEFNIIKFLEIQFFIEKLQEIIFVGQKKIKLSSHLCLNIVSISYSITSILLLLKYTALNKYSFYWSSTWISKEIIYLFSKPVELLSLNIIPNELEQENIYNFVSSDVKWLWFLIVLTFILIIIPKIILLIINKNSSEKNVPLKNVPLKNEIKNEIKNEDNSKKFINIIFWLLTKTIKAIIRTFIKAIMRVLGKKDNQPKAMAVLKKDFIQRLDNSFIELSVILYKIINEEERYPKNSYSQIDEKKEEFKNKLFNTEKKFYEYIEQEWSFNKLEKELEDFKNIDIHSEKLNETSNLFKKYLSKESPKINLLVEKSDVILKLNDKYKYDFLKKMYFYIELISLRSNTDRKMPDLRGAQDLSELPFNEKDINKILKEKDKDRFTEELKKIMRKNYEKKYYEIFL